MKPSSVLQGQLRTLARLLPACLIAGIAFLKAHAQTPLRLDLNLQQDEPNLLWNSSAGAVYHVLSRTSLASGAWEKRATIVAPGLASEWRDDRTQNNTRFYRLLQGDSPLSAQMSVVHSSMVSPLLLQTLTNGSYLQARSFLQTVLPAGQFRLPLPLPDLEPFPEILLEGVQVYFDNENRSITFWGTATLLNQPVELLVTASWDPQTATPTFALGIKLTELTLSMLSEALGSSSVAGLDFKNSVIILAQGNSVLDPLKLPGKAFWFYDGEEIQVDRGVNFFKEIDLSPLPLLKGLKLFGIPETKLALQGILAGIDPNLFFNGIRSQAPTLLHLHSFLENNPLPGQPAWLSTVSRRLDLSLLAGGAPLGAFNALAATTNPPPLVTLTDEYHVQIGGDALKFETVSDLSSLIEEGTVTVNGTTTNSWIAPLGVQWLTLTNLAIELLIKDGEVIDAELSANWNGNGLGGEAKIEVPDQEDPSAEFTLTTTNDFDSAQIASFLQAHVGLSVTTNQLPETLVIKEPVLIVKSEPDLSLSITGVVSVLGDLDSKVLVTVFEKDGERDLLVSIQPGDLKLRHLIPSLTNTFLGDITLPIGGFTSGEEAKTVPSNELDSPAQDFFAPVHGPSGFSLSVKSGVDFDAVLPLSAFPPTVLQSLGLNSNDRIVLNGAVNFTVGLLTGNGPISLDRLRMQADLPLNVLPGLPASLQPITVLSRKLVLNYEAGAMDVVLESSIRVTIDGKPVVFDFRASLMNTPQGGNVELVGALAGTWTNPFGIDWLTMDSVKLRLSGSTNASEAALSGRFSVGSKTVETAIQVGLVAGQPSATLRATIDQLSLTELISWTQQRFEVSPFGDQPPGGLLDLRQVTFEIQSSPSPQLSITANATVLNGIAAKVLFTMVRQNGTNEPVLSIALDNFSLGELSQRFAGTLAGDLRFPAVAHTFSRTPLAIPSGDLSGDARAFFQKVYGSLDFTFRTEGAVSFGAQLPLSLLPAPALATLGMNAADKVTVEGTIGISFAMLSGSAAVEITQLDLEVELPNARPVKLPSWMTADPSVQRTLAFSFRNLPGPENALAIRIKDVIGITVDNARRTFILSTALSSTGQLTFNGTMVGNWTKPFGVDWLTLEQVSLSFSTDGIQSQGAIRSSFPLGNKSISLAIEVSGGGTQGTVVELTGAVDQLSINDVIELVRRQVDRPLFPNAPPADFAALNNVSMTIRLGRTKSFSIGATGQLAGQETELLWTIESVAGQEPHILLGMQPKGWSLSGAFPSLSNSIVDGLTLPTPTLVFANYEKQKQPEDLQEEEKNFYGKVFGAGNFSLKVPSGLGLMGGIPVNSLPTDGAFRQLLRVLGMPAENLILEGSLGNSLSLITGGGGGADALKGLSLHIGLPPMRPNGSPAWFRSGQLSLKITGAPSVSVVGEVTTEIEGDILTFFIESGISFPGPTLQLVGGLKAGGGWTSPFGVEWMTLNELIVVLGVDATGSVKLGFSGDLIVGEKDIQVAALLAVNATGVPTNLIFEGSSTEGLALSDIVALQAQIASVTSAGAPAIPIDRLPEMAVRNILLKIAPRPEPSLGIERGFAFSGDFYMQVQQGGPLQHVAGARFKVGEGEISASGAMVSGTLGPITWRDPYLDLLLSRQEQHFMVGGFADVQFLEGDLDLALSKEQMSLDLDARILDRWDVHLQGESDFNFETPNFPVNGNMLGDFLGNVTAEAKDRLGEVANQGKSAIANAEGLVSSALNLRGLKDQEIGAKINALIDELDVAKRAMDAAYALRNSALSAMNSARIARDLAWNLYVATPSWQPVLKAAYYADYVAKAALYSARYAAYQAANASYFAARAAYELIPPIEQNPIIVALRRELNELTQLLNTRLQQLSALRDTFRTVIDAVQQGLITIENASFDTDLRGLIDSHKVQMRITVVLLGVRQQFLPTWDFNLTVRENLKPVIDEILRQKGII